MPYEDITQGKDKREIELLQKRFRSITNFIDNEIIGRGTNDLYKENLLNFLNKAGNLKDILIEIRNEVSKQDAVNNLVNNGSESDYEHSVGNFESNVLGNLKRILNGKDLPSFAPKILLEEAEYFLNYLKAGGLYQKAA